MRLVCGVDGCISGWVVISKDIDTGAISWRLCKTTRAIVEIEPEPLVIAIDIPIGLPDRGPRACDHAARKLLGPGRASSVFPAPIRPVLSAGSYGEAGQIRLQIEGKKMSRQSWLITRKIREVDDLLRQDLSLQARVHEVHPEICFYFLAGKRPLRNRKKSIEGQSERIALLEPIFDHWLADALAQRKHLASAVDDVLDAFAALWTAERIWMGISQSIPADPPVDAFGLRMVIIA
jgi:predicted RNase H-like nuclease